MKYFNEIFAIPNLQIDTIKNVLKFSKSSKAFGGEGLKIRTN